MITAGCLDRKCNTAEGYVPMPCSENLAISFIKMGHVQRKCQKQQCTSLCIQSDLASYVRQILSQSYRIINSFGMSTMRTSSPYGPNVNRDV